MTPAPAAETMAPGGGDGSQPRGGGGDRRRKQRRSSDHDEIEEAEDVAMTGNKIVVTPAAKAVMDAITTRADADGPSPVTVKLLEKDCEEGGRTTT